MATSRTHCCFRDGRSGATVFETRFKGTNVEYKFRIDDLCLIFGAAGMLALLLISEVVVQDGGDFPHGVTMKTVAAGNEQTDGPLVFRGPDDNVVAIKFGDDVANFGKVDVGRTLDVESARFRGRLWILRSEGSQAAYAIER